MNLRFFAADREWALSRPPGGYRRPAVAGWNDAHGTRVLLATLRDDASAMRRVRAFMEDPWVSNRGPGRLDHEVLDDLAEALARGTLVLERGEVRRLRPSPAGASTASSESEAAWQEAEATPGPEEPQGAQESPRVDEHAASTLAAANRQWHAEGQALQAHCSGGSCEVCEAQLKVLVD